jgi:membrane fusion protein (multidrug efflux system)
MKWSFLFRGLAALIVPWGTVALASSPSAAAVLARQNIRAQLVPSRHTVLSAELNARVLTVALPEGGSFKEGEELVVLDGSYFRAQLQRAEADWAAARAALAANVQLERLNSVGGLELEQSKAAVARAEAELEAARVLLARCRITAPYAGRVAEKKIREQEYVQAGQPLLEIIDDRHLELECIVPSRWLTWLRPGVEFAVVIDEFNRSFPARFERIGARVDPISQTVKVVGLIAGEYPELMAGMSGQIQVAVPSQP